MRSDLGNLLKALGRLEEAKVCQNMSTVLFVTFVTEVFLLFFGSMLSFCF